MKPEFGERVPEWSRDEQNEGKRAYDRVKDRRRRMRRSIRQSQPALFVDRPQCHTLGRPHFWDEADICTRCGKSRYHARVRTPLRCPDHGAKHLRRVGGRLGGWQCLEPHRYSDGTVGPRLLTRW